MFTTVPAKECTHGPAGASACSGRGKRGLLYNSQAGLSVIKTPLNPHRDDGIAGANLVGAFDEVFIFLSALGAGIRETAPRGRLFRPVVPVALQAAPSEIWAQRMFSGAMSMWQLRL